MEVATVSNEPDFYADEQFDDGTTAFGEDEVDAIVYLPPSDSPELRASQNRNAMTPQFQPSTPMPIPPDESPVEPWTPPTHDEPTAASTSKMPETLGKAASEATNTVVRVGIGIALVALPVLAVLWLIRTGMSISGN